MCHLKLGIFTPMLWSCWAKDGKPMDFKVSHWHLIKASAAWRLPQAHVTNRALLHVIFSWHMKIMLNSAGWFLLDSQILRHQAQLEDLLNHGDGSDVRAYGPVYIYIYNVLFLPGNDFNFNQHFPQRLRYKNHAWPNWKTFVFVSPSHQLVRVAPCFQKYLDTFYVVSNACSVQGRAAKTISSLQHGVFMKQELQGCVAPKLRSYMKPQGEPRRDQLWNVDSGKSWDCMFYGKDIL